MVNLTYRISDSEPAPQETTVKGSPLTNYEIDANFKALADELGQISNRVTSLGQLTNQVTSLESEIKTIKTTYMKKSEYQNEVDTAYASLS